MKRMRTWKGWCVVEPDGWGSRPVERRDCANDGYPLKKGERITRVEVREVPKRRKHPSKRCRSCDEERPLLTDNEKWRLMADGIVARPPLTGDNLRAAIIGLVSAAADEARAEEREACVTAVLANACGECDHESCGERRAAAHRILRSRGGERGEHGGKA